MTYHEWHNGMLHIVSDDAKTKVHFGLSAILNVFCGHRRSVLGIKLLL